MPKMTKAKRAKLMGLLPMTTSIEKKVVPSIFEKEGIDEEFIPTFKIKQMSEADMLLLMSNGSNVDSVSLDKQVGLIDEIVNRCVIGWDNLIDISTGDLMDFEDYEPSILPISIKGELFTEIINISGISN